MEAAAQQQEESKTTYTSMSNGAMALILGALCLVFVGMFAFAYGWRPSFMGMARGVAAEKISASFDFRASKLAVIHLGNLQKWDRSPETQNEYAALEKAGFITTRKGRSGWHVDVTPAGEKAFQAVDATRDHEKDGDYFAIPLATREMVRVTGISINGNLAQVDFDWKWKMNSLGLLFATADYSVELRERETGNTAIYSGDEFNTAIFKKWDDGWRLQSLNFTQ